MNAALGWGLAVLAIGIGYMSYGWQGVALGITMIVFWLLLQFSRTLRAMRKAGEAPLGLVSSAVMLSTKLRTGLKMLEVLALAGSLGERVSEQPEVWRWHDTGGDAILLTFEQGGLSSWVMQRAPMPDERPGAVPRA
jgi:hypothetical protein